MTAAQTGGEYAGSQGCDVRPDDGGRCRAPFRERGQMTVARRRWLTAYVLAVFAFATGLMDEARPASAQVDECPAPHGYRLAAGDGGVFAFGHVAFHGSAAAMALNAPVVGIAETPSRNGYWLVAADGGVFAFGDAPFHGSMAGIQLKGPVVGIARTPSGDGYWIAAADGGVFAFGDAPFLGSAGNLTGISDVAAVVANPAGRGYWLLRRSGRPVLAYGEARAFPLARDEGRPSNPQIGMAATPSGRGYWTITPSYGPDLYGDATDFGGVTTLFSGGASVTSISFGSNSTRDVVFRGPQDPPMVGISSTATGSGYRMVFADGGVAVFGDAVRCSRFAGTALNRSIVGIT